MFHFTKKKYLGFTGLLKINMGIDENGRLQLADQIQNSSIDIRDLTVVGNVRKPISDLILQGPYEFAWE